MDYRPKGGLADKSIPPKELRFGSAGWPGTEESRAATSGCGVNHHFRKGLLARAQGSALCSARAPLE